MLVPITHEYFLGRVEHVYKGLALERNGFDYAVFFKHCEPGHGLVISFHE